VSGLKTTPGPWATNCSHIYAPDGAIIAVVHNPGSKASDYPLVANRDLMAAAPELYETLEDLFGSTDYRVAGLPIVPVPKPFAQGCQEGTVSDHLILVQVGRERGLAKRAALEAIAEAEAC
jgi:hypothetical protein